MGLSGFIPQSVERGPGEISSSLRTGSEITEAVRASWEPRRAGVFAGVSDPESACHLMSSLVIRGHGFPTGLVHGLFVWLLPRGNRKQYFAANTNEIQSHVT